jgi:transposase
MNIVAAQTDFVIGIDTHKESHTAALVSASGQELDSLTVPADRRGYRQLLEFAEQRAAAPRVWAVEGTGSYGSGLTEHLLRAGEKVVEVDRPKRPVGRNRAKSDQLDAVRAAREALSQKHSAEPRQGGQREALRVLLVTREAAVGAYRSSLIQLKSLVTNAPEALRDQLRRLPSRQLSERCAGLRTPPEHSLEHRATATALRLTAHRVLAARDDIADLDSQLEPLVKQLAPRLLAQSGVGPVSAAHLLCGWSHRGRLRDEAAFASLAGVAPIEASSGQIVRHRLNRGGDRKLNRALHTIALCGGVLDHFVRFV